MQPSVTSILGFTVVFFWWLNCFLFIKFRESEAQNVKSDKTVVRSLKGDAFVNAFIKISLYIGHYLMVATGDAHRQLASANHRTGYCKRANQRGRLSIQTTVRLTDKSRDLSGKTCSWWLRTVLMNVQLLFNIYLTGCSLNVYTVWMLWRLGRMKTRDSPPPVHVHVPETTPVHVHMRRSPSKTPQVIKLQLTLLNWKHYHFFWPLVTRCYMERYGHQRLNVPNACNIILYLMCINNVLPDFTCTDLFTCLE